MSSRRSGDTIPILGERDTAGGSPPAAVDGSPQRNLSRAALLMHFEEIERRLAASGATADLYVVGGAAMTLAHDESRLTGAIEFSHLLSAYPEQWHRRLAGDGRTLPGEMPPPLTTAASVCELLPVDEDPATVEVFSRGSLRVRCASAERMLAMKMVAGHRKDRGDIRTLVGRTRIGSLAEALALCAAVLPDEPVPASSRKLVAALVAGRDAA